MREILVVCYGNICRSPMAEVLLADALDRRLGPGHDIVVSSAGTHAYDGNPASSDGVEVMARRGLDLARHRARLVTPALIRRAERIVCMTREHRDHVLALAPDAAGKTATLGDDVPDPIGGTPEDYEHVADFIAQRLVSIVNELAGASAKERS